jgi:GTPase SAR1 family protein
MATLLTGFSILLAEAAAKLYQRLHALNFGVYGASKVGKTTLHHQLRTRGEVPNIAERTVGLKRTTRKVVKIDKDSRTIKTADVGGQTYYWDAWKTDMMNRSVRYIIFMIDDRHLNEAYNLDNQLGWQFMVDTVCDEYWRLNKNKSKKKKEKDFPVAVGIWANKYDLWKAKYEHNGSIEKHPIFEPFKLGMQRLQDRGIPCFKYIVSAKSDPEMVYRGIMTMVKEY